MVLDDGLGGVVADVRRSKLLTGRVVWLVTHRLVESQLIHLLAGVARDELAVQCGGRCLQSRDDHEHCTQINWQLFVDVWRLHKIFNPNEPHLTSPISMLNANVLPVVRVEGVEEPRQLVT